MPDISGPPYLHDDAIRQRRRPLPPVVWEVPTSLDYWRRTAIEFPPPGTRDRYDRLNLYSELWAGQRGGLRPYGLGDNHVTINLYRRVCHFISSALLSSGPEVMEDAPEPPPLPAAPEPSEDEDGSAAPPMLPPPPPEPEPAIDLLTQRRLHNALRGALRDYTRHGVGIMLARRDDQGRPDMQAVDPAAWFPAGDGFGAIVALSHAPGSMHPDRATVDTIEPGRYTRQFREFSMGGGIGRVLSTEAWDTGVEASPLVWVTRDREAGAQWGISAFEDMIPLCESLDRRVSVMDDALTIHGRPLLAYDRDATFAGPIDQSGDTTGARLRLEQVQLGQQYETAHSVLVVPPRYKDARYLAWDPQLQGHLSAISQIASMLSMGAGVPGALLGALSQTSQHISGTSLKRVYVPTWLLFDDMIDAWTPAVAQVLSKALEATGETKDWEEWNVEWANPLDEMEEGGAPTPPARTPHESASAGVGA